MTKKITYDCDLCGLCMRLCPIQAIQKGDFKMYVQQERCIDCNNCLDFCINIVTKKEDINA